MNVQFASPDRGSHRVRHRNSKPLSTAQRSQLPQRRARSNLMFRSRKRVLLGGYGADACRAGSNCLCPSGHADQPRGPASRNWVPRSRTRNRFDGPVLIAGDFNTNDMQWVSHVVPVPWPGWQATRVRDLMAQNGFHTPFTNRRATFDHLGMQLDWIFLRNLAQPGGHRPDGVSRTTMRWWR